MTMQLIEDFFKHYPVLIQLSLLMVFVVFIKWWVLGVRLKLGAEAKLPRQILYFFILLISFVSVVFILPISESLKGQILSLVGVLLTGVVALSSTTFVANAMSGLLLRLINSFKPGDFIKVNEQFGRVTQRGLFHCEIQTEDRDLTTIPNLYLMTNSVTVMHKTGTIISVSLSLGYDISHQEVEPLLLQAAQETELTDTFVMLTQLGDFSITYKVSGYLEDVTRMLTVRSKLRKNILMVLHQNNIEIVSPNFVNQRVFDVQSQFIPIVKSPKKEVETQSTAEDIMFDKAQLAEEIEKITTEDEVTQTKITHLIDAVDSVDDESLKEQLLKQIDLLKASVKTD